MSPSCKNCQNMKFLVVDSSNHQVGSTDPTRQSSWENPQVLISHFPRHTWASNRVGFNHYMLGATFVGYHVPSPYNYHNWLSKIAALNHIFLKSAKLTVKLGNATKMCVFCLVLGGSFCDLLFDRIYIQCLGSHLHAGFSAKVGNVIFVSRGFLIRCEQRIWCFSSCIIPKNRGSNTWICKSLCINSPLMHPKVYWQFFWEGLRV